MPMFRPRKCRRIFLGSSIWRVSGRHRADERDHAKQRGGEVHLQRRLHERRKAEQRNGDAQGSHGLSKPFNACVCMSSESSAVYLDADRRPTKRLAFVSYQCDRHEPRGCETNGSRIMRCVYCCSEGPFTDEHVLARAFAGSGENWTLKELVCAQCNGLFSNYGRAWTSEPGAAMARNYWGPAGRARKGQAYQVHPSESVFLLADDDPVADEVDILRGIEPRFRAQVISTRDAMFTTASDADGAKRLSDATSAFWKDRAVTIQKRDRPGPKQFRVAILGINGTFRFERLEWRPKPPPVWVGLVPRRVCGVS